MTKEHYKIAIRSQKRLQRRPTKLIHLLINFRSHNYERYPPDFTGVMRECKRGSKLLDYAGLWLFLATEGNRWNVPSNERKRSYNIVRSNESELPF